MMPHSVNESKAFFKHDSTPCHPHTQDQKVFCHEMELSETWAKSKF